jgi:hypothetical protein
VKLTLVSYADARFGATQKSLCDSARACGFDAVRAAGPADLAADFVRENAKILSAPRGAGFWLWKPWIIRDALRKAAPGEVVLYCDAGRSPYYDFDRRPERLAARTLASSWVMTIGPAQPVHGPAGRWTKRDCFALMDADTPEMAARPMIQATWSLWTPHARAFAFLDQWLAYCRDPRCLTDMANTEGRSDHAGFVEHRHDQSILTLLAHREGAPYLDLTDTGIFRYLSLRPQSAIAHTMLKAPRNAERLLAGAAPTPLILREHFVLRRANARAHSAAIRPLAARISRR